MVSHSSNSIYRKLTRRRTALLLIGPAYFLLVAIMAIAARQCSWPSCEHSTAVASYALSLLPAVAIVWAALIYLGVRCPSCHRSAFKIEGKFAGLPFHSLAIGDECQHCGESFKIPKSSAPLMRFLASAFIAGLACAATFGSLSAEVKPKNDMAGLSLGTLVPDIDGASTVNVGSLECSQYRPFELTCLFGEHGEISMKVAQYLSTREVYSIAYSFCSSDPVAKVKSEVYAAFNITDQLDGEPGLSFDNWEPVRSVAKNVSLKLGMTGGSCGERAVWYRLTIWDPVVSAAETSAQEAVTNPLIPTPKF